MYVSRLNFHTLPGKTHEVSQQLKMLAMLVRNAGGGSPRILRAHYSSLGAPDVVFEQEAPDLASLEAQIAAVTQRPEFQEWSRQTSALLAEPPKREVYLLVE